MDHMLAGLAVQPAGLEAVNRFLQDSDNPVIRPLLEVVRKYGTPQEINARAREARQLPNLLRRLHEIGSPHLKGLRWLASERDDGAFVTIDDYALEVLGAAPGPRPANDRGAVTLEISALQYFPWLLTEAVHAIDRQDLMPGRYIRVRKMKEQEQDEGDILAVAAAMQIIGASYVETLDTRGTDGSNTHLGGPETITGYFGGVGQPNEHALQWADEFLHYYTSYGIQQVLNLNPGTVLIGYLLYQIGIDLQFKLSVFMGNDNPYTVLWTLLGARLFARPDGTTPLAGFNFANSVNNRTIELSAEIRRALGLEDVVRFEHHVTEAWRSVVRQPYDRREELVEIASRVANLSAKHEGGDVEVETDRVHPSDILDYFRDKGEIEASGEMPLLLRNYLDKHDAVNRTARALISNGIPVVAARYHHHEEAADGASHHAASFAGGRGA